MRRLWHKVPDQALLSYLLEGVRLEADVELQIVLVPHLTSLPLGFSSVEKEIRRLQSEQVANGDAPTPTHPKHLLLQHVRAQSSLAASTPPLATEMRTQRLGFGYAPQNVRFNKPDAIGARAGVQGLYEEARDEPHGRGILYLAYHGPHSLAPGRAEPMKYSMVVAMNAIAEGAKVGKLTWSDVNHGIFMFKRLNLVMWPTALRLAEIVRHTSKELMYLTRGCLTWSLSGVIIAYPKRSHPAVDHAERRLRALGSVAVQARPVG